MGIGDALYVQSVARHLISRGQELTVCSHWSDVFRPLQCRVVPFTRVGVDIVAHYPSRKAVKGTTQFEDCCISAGIREKVPLRLDWTVTDQAIVDRVLKVANGRPIVCVQMPRNPMGRDDGFGAELMPNGKVLRMAVARLRDRACIVQFGAGQALFGLDVEVDLSNQTTVAQMLDVASVAQGFIGYPSFMVPLAESLQKPAFILFSDAGLRSRTIFIRQITPDKILHGPYCRWAVDNSPVEKINEGLDAILRA